MGVWLEAPRLRYFWICGHPECRTSGCPAARSARCPPSPLSNMKQKQDARVLTCANWKGGVGKTTTAVNIAAGAARCFAAAGVPLRVLLVDMDAQASASRCLGVPRGDTGHAEDVAGKR